MLSRNQATVITKCIRLSIIQNPRFRSPQHGNGKANFETGSQNAPTVHRPVRHFTGSLSGIETPTHHGVLEGILVGCDQLVGFQGLDVTQIGRQGNAEVVEWNVDLTSQGSLVKADIAMGQSKFLNINIYLKNNTLIYNWILQSENYFLPDSA